MPLTWSSLRTSFKSIPNSEEDLNDIVFLEEPGKFEKLNDVLYSEKIKNDVIISSPFPSLETNIVVPRILPRTLDVRDGRNKSLVLKYALSSSEENKRISKRIKRLWSDQKQNLYIIRRYKRGLTHHKHIKNYTANTIDHNNLKIFNTFKDKKRMNMAEWISLDHQPYRSINRISR